VNHHLNLNRHHIWQQQLAIALAGASSSATPSIPVRQRNAYPPKCQQSRWRTFWSSAQHIAQQVATGEKVSRELSTRNSDARPFSFQPRCAVWLLQFPAHRWKIKLHRTCASHHAPTKHFVSSARTSLCGDIHSTQACGKKMFRLSVWLQTSVA
jgi:hypothetical protein